MKVKNHPYVESYNAYELQNGVIVLQINCNQREIYFHRYTDEQYLICGTEEEFESIDDKFILNTKKFIDRLDRGKSLIYICAETKEKDQISFYYIPYEKDFRKTMKNLL